LITKRKAQQIVTFFRDSLPYINAHRGRTFVLVFGGEAVEDPGFPNLIHDLALLSSLGVRLVVVPGARPQIERRLTAQGVEVRYVHGLRVTDQQALACVKEAVGSVRVEIEALLSMGVANSPMHGARIRVVSGNFVTAKPLGVRDGVDFQHTGEVRRIDTAALTRVLDEGAIALLAPIGYSPTGEAFNVTAEDVATAAAVALKADKLLCLVDGPGLMDDKRKLIPELTVSEAEALLAAGSKPPAALATHLVAGVHACRGGVRRAHLITRDSDGGLLTELFTRDGSGTLITNETFEDTRDARIDDVAGILELLRPMEEEGILVRRSRERLEMEIDRFVVVERDGLILATAALYPFAQEGVAELACLAVHPDYRRSGRGDALLTYMERGAKAAGADRLFVLTTHTAHWFQERGFLPAEPEDLPVERQTLYNYQRNSKVFVKSLSG
jgi:amino-acid N-acetyltransferase